MVPLGPCIPLRPSLHVADQQGIRSCPGQTQSVRPNSGLVCKRPGLFRLRCTCLPNRPEASSVLLLSCAKAVLLRSPFCATLRPAATARLTSSGVKGSPPSPAQLVGARSMIARPTPQGSSPGPTSSFGSPRLKGRRPVLKRGGGPRVFLLLVLLAGLAMVLSACVPLRVGGAALEAGALESAPGRALERDSAEPSVVRSTVTLGRDGRVIRETVTVK